MDEPWYRALAPARRPTGRPGYSEIIPGLYVGEYPTPDDAEWLAEELEVTAVINLQDEMDLESKFLRVRELQQQYRLHGLLFHHVPIIDGDIDSLVARLPHLVELMHNVLESGGSIYLHCNAGMNRAPTVAIAYIREHLDLSLENACKLVKRQRPCLPYMKALERG